MISLIRPCSLGLAAGPFATVSVFGNWSCLLLPQQALSPLSHSFGSYPCSLLVRAHREHTLSPLFGFR